MPFKVRKSTTYKWPVSVDVPVDGGRFSRETFEVEFRNDIEQSTLKDFADGLTDGTMIEQEVARRVIVSLEGFIDEEGEPIPYSNSLLDEILEVPMVAAQICQGYVDSKAGAKRKN